MELETASSFFPSLQIYKGTSPVCIEDHILDDVEPATEYFWKLVDIGISPIWKH